MVKYFASTTKKIYDPILGFITFDDFEKSLIDSVVFQRLHYIRQLGVTYLVYPGATHTRFEHSLGVMELATRIYKKVCKALRPDLIDFIPRKGSSLYRYWLKVLRMAALCHDLGHLPFSHVAEKDLLGDAGHEKITMDFINSSFLNPVWEKLQQTPGFDEKLIKRNVKEDILKIAIGKAKAKILLPDTTFSSWEKILSQMINGDFFGADRIDYLLRDSKCTGVVYGLFDYLQLIEMLRILPVIDGKEGDLELGIDEKGIESCESLLLARYFMHKRVYQYASVKSYNFHVKRFMRKTFKEEAIWNDLEHFIEFTDSFVIQRLYQASHDKKAEGYFDAKSIIERKKQFKAIVLPENITEEFLLDFKNKNKIPDEKIDWEIENQRMIENDFSFPIAKRYMFLQKAKDCSSLLSKLPASSWNWVYIDPEFEILLLEALR